MRMTSISILQVWWRASRFCKHHEEHTPSLTTSISILQIPTKIPRSHMNYRGICHSCSFLQFSYLGLSICHCVQGMMCENQVFFFVSLVCEFVFLSSGDLFFSFYDLFVLDVTVAWPRAWLPCNPSSATRRLTESELQLRDTPFGSPLP